jgi:glycine cleavage system regulatory protein
MAINESFVITILGRDEPGLVGRVSAAVAENAGNWLHSHLSAAAGHFGGIVHVTVPKENSSRLASALQSLRNEGILVEFQSIVESDESRTEVEVELDLIGQDRPGILSQVSEAVAGRGINVDELKTEIISAPMSGAEMFRAHALLSLPAGVSVEQLRQDLERIASDLMIDISIRPVEETSPET